MSIRKTGFHKPVGRFSNLIGYLGTGLGDRGDSGDTGETSGVSGLTGPLGGAEEVATAVLTISLGRWSAGDGGRGGVASPRVSSLAGTPSSSGVSFSGGSSSSSGVVNVDKGEGRRGCSRWKRSSAAFMLRSAS